MSKLCLFFALMFLSTLAFAEQAEIFPQNLHSKNTILRFEVDSTWHLIEGRARKVSGKVWLNDKTDLGSIHAEILIRTDSLDTGNSMRDKRLREVMSAKTYPDIRFRALGVTEVCDLAALGADAQCATTINGKLTLRDITKELRIPVQILKQDAGFLIRGKTSIQWADYGVEDPSILIAKLDRTVTISFDVFFETKLSGDKL